MSPIESDPIPPSGFWAGLLPNPVSQVVAIVLFILSALFCILRFVLPSPRLASMNKAFDDMGKLHDKAVDAHMFNSPLEAEIISNEFLELDDRARELRIKTLHLGLSTPPALWWWKEVRYGFSIMMCTWDIGILQQKIQLITERRTNDLNMTPTVGVTSAQQVLLRRQRTLDSEA
ncbi:hypothetical protein B0H14DRAFT_3899576 [Mycena olivaceomarginata]|nr:hypothetical protein B0H14DRAFT_3899576 [Mycena olivaceomarginata]